MPQKPQLSEKDKLIRAKALAVSQLKHHQEMVEFYDREANRRFANGEIKEGEKYVDWRDEELRRSNTYLFMNDVFAFYEGFISQTKENIALGLS